MRAQEGCLDEVAHELGLDALGRFGHGEMINAFCGQVKTGREEEKKTDRWTESRTLVGQMPLESRSLPGTRQVLRVLGDGTEGAREAER